ncbi:acetate--CoA ligase [Halogeometricum borinquense]|uniref:Acetate--CoA ligase n=2 Tax=Halogeometricum borinquense (strain ATCC 700274 / DSM 11551 / JCM 10706 / KCTC 4070 / PR3) TaxID=469382 RepID=E4NW49_HALBP|nr:acetyl-coenzyme A synthetase [Halogeometricum borinquense DSM 11551]
MSNGRGPDSETGLGEYEKIDPPTSFAEQATVTDESIYDEFNDTWPDCWERAAATIDWSEPYECVLPNDEPPFEWFAGGTLNASYNCLDRHIEAGAKNRVAIKWESHLGETRTYTYQDLYREVNEFAAALRAQGVEEDDVVTLYMPMIPELPIAMLACARIGAPHNVVFAGLSADALATRLESADSEYLVTCDGYYRRGNAIFLKSKAEDARLKTPHDLSEMVLVEHLGEAEHLGETQHTYDELVSEHAGAEVAPVDRSADDVLFLIHTSGTTGEPKRVEHVTGGYLAHVTWTSQAVLDLKPGDTYLCTANIGWISGHSYVVYGPLAVGATTVMYEGTPNYPEKDRIWSLIEQNAVDVFYTAPTAIRAFMKWGAEYPAQHDLSSLRLLGTVGEPINPRAWQWYYEHVGNEECPIVDTWWQTETGGMMIATLPGIDAMKPGVAGPPLPGTDAKIVDGSGEAVPPNDAGYLVLTRPWPGMPLALRHGRRWGREGTSEIEVNGWNYFTGDGARVDEDGYITVLGRIDDVINVSGYRLGTMEIESAIVDVEGVVEAAVVSVDNAETGGVHAYVTLEAALSGDEQMRERIASHVRERIGPIATLDAVVFTPDLPKTRSGKIMRRFLENIANGEEFGDTSTLRNPEIVGELKSIVRDD